MTRIATHVMYDTRDVLMKKYKDSANVKYIDEIIEQKAKQGYLEAWIHLGNLDLNTTLDIIELCNYYKSHGYSVKYNDGPIIIGWHS